jgi:hypothetical protein
MFCCLFENLVKGKETLRGEFKVLNDQFYKVYNSLSKLIFDATKLINI